MHLLAFHFVLQVVIDGPHKGKEEEKELNECVYMLLYVECSALLTCHVYGLTAFDLAPRRRSIIEQESTFAPKQQVLSTSVVMFHSRTEPRCFASK